MFWLPFKREDYWSGEKMPPEIHLVFRLGQAMGFFPFTVEGDSRRLAFNWYRVLLL